MATQRDTVRSLLDEYGTTYADEAGIRLTDKPSPVYQLAVLATLLSTRITANIAIAAARELFKAGYRTPRTMTEASWQDRVDALVRGHYRRYDESTSTRLAEAADLIIDRHQGDLRRLRGDGLHEDIQQLPGIGPSGADIFCREAQAIWPELRPFFDRKALDGAHAARLPADPAKLATLVSGNQVAVLASALVRRSLDS